MPADKTARSHGERSSSRRHEFLPPLGEGGMRKCALSDRMTSQDDKKPSTVGFLAGEKTATRSAAPAGGQAVAARDAADVATEHDVDQRVGRAGRHRPTGARVVA